MEKINFSQGITALAPLAGYTDLPFRSLVKKFDADLTFSEMISANALVHNSKKTFEMLKKSPLEKPYIVQIAGSDLDVIKKAVEVLNTIDGIDGIDLNCGCPVPKVVSQCAGSSLLKDLSLLQRVLETIRKYSNKDYLSAKVRLGFDEKIPEEIALACERAGVDFMSIHGRTRAGRYKAEVDYEAIKRAKDAVSIPVIANGDITSLKKANEVKNITGCKSIMIGRGAVGNPWIFYQIKNNLEFVNKDKIKEIVLEHYDNMIDFYGEKGASIFRKHLHTYSKGFPEASAFRDKVNRIENVDEMRKYIEIFFS
ncbi:MAG: tRNA-dihydrouridine synthase [Sulfurospirillaceae bacterium]|nr:tRNA-dihydrouridine synthase [Sulfurospirillaceae bacterium]